MSHFSRELCGLEDWNLIHTWAVGRCIMYTGIRLLLLIRSFISFFFLSNFQHWNFSSHFSQELWGLEDWKLVYTWKVYRPESGCCCLFVPLFLHFSFQFSTLKLFVTLFSRTVSPRRVKLGTHVDSGQMYHVYRNPAAAAYLSLYFFIFLFLQFSTLKCFVTLFSRTVRPRWLKIGIHVESRQMYHVYQNQAAAPYSSLYFFIFLSLQFSTLKFFMTLFSGTVRPRRLKLCTHIGSGQLYLVYWNQAAAAYSSLYFFIFLSLPIYKY